MSNHSPSRYDKLREKIDREFTRQTTLTPGLAANERQTLISLDDHTDTYSISERFEKFGPFNALYVRNRSSSDVRVYLGQNRESYVTVPSSVNQAVAVAENVPSRYYRFLEVEERSATSVSSGDLEIQVGNELDGVELSLLRDAGLLDV